MINAGRGRNLKQREGAAALKEHHCLVSKLELKNVQLKDADRMHHFHLLKNQTRKSDDRDKVTQVTLNVRRLTPFRETHSPARARRSALTPSWFPRDKGHRCGGFQSVPHIQGPTKTKPAQHKGRKIQSGSAESDIRLRAGQNRFCRTSINVKAHVAQR